VSFIPNDILSQAIQNYKTLYWDYSPLTSLRVKNNQSFEKMTKNLETIEKFSSSQCIREDLALKSKFEVG
jgi:hypothetical protein